MGRTCGNTGMTGDAPGSITSQGTRSGGYDRSFRQQAVRPFRSRNLHWSAENPPGSCSQGTRRQGSCSDEYSLSPQGIRFRRDIFFPGIPAELHLQGSDGTDGKTVQAKDTAVRPKILLLNTDAAAAAGPGAQPAGSTCTGQKTYFKEGKTGKTTQYETRRTDPVAVPPASA